MRRVGVFELPLLVLPPLVVEGNSQGERRFLVGQDADSTIGPPSPALPGSAGAGHDVQTPQAGWEHCPETDASLPLLEGVIL